MHFLDCTLPTVAENLALDEALLDGAQHVSDELANTTQAGSEQANRDPADWETLRLWQAESPFIVLGRSSRVNDEVYAERAAQAAIPVFRRISGGATVVAGPGCMFYTLVLSLERRPHLRMLDQAHHSVMTTLQQALQPLVPQLLFDGTCDLVLDGRKVSGNSVRMVRQWMLYHGTLLLGMDLELVEHLLPHPPREPPYRRGRSHADFLANLQLPYPVVMEALRQAWQATQTRADLPTHRIQILLRDKYSQPQWNLQR